MQNVIAVVFDFDDTLGPDSTSGFFESFGWNPVLFWDECAGLYAEGWDPVPAYLYKMLKKSQSARAGARVTREALSAWGRRVGFYKGVRGLFKLLETHVHEANPAAEVEFYLISSGIGEILRSTPIARHFKEIWACDFQYNRKGEIEFPKKIISFTDKTRYLFQISKGIVGEGFRNRPFEVNRAVPPAELRVPFEHMIFIGDGYTDIPCFSLVRKQGGVAFGVYDPCRKDKWHRAWKYIEDRRITNLAPADYRQNAALTQNLMMAIKNILTHFAHEVRSDGT